MRRWVRLGAMTVAEFELLARLAGEPDVAVSRGTLMSDVWDENWFGSTKTLAMHVAALRRKLTAAGVAAPEIVTLRAHGFRLQTPPPPAPVL